MGCEVNSFDPTVYLPERLAPNVTFHQWGLQAGNIPQEDMQKNYGSFKGPLYSLQTVIARLGHHNRRISILKIDCEGCEWDAFQSLSSLKGSLHGPDQLLFEAHLSTQYGIKGEAELGKIQRVYDFLFEPDVQGMSFQRYYWHDNIGFNGMRTISDTLLAAGVPPGTCCREMGFVRRPHNHTAMPHAAMPRFETHAYASRRHHTSVHSARFRVAAAEP